MSIDTLLERLEKVRSNGADRWMACCPAHDDKSPSLSVRATDGKILVYCFAGCPSDDVLAAVDLKWGDLFSDRWDAAKNAAYHGKHKLPKVDPVEHERLILELARDSVKRGENLSIEDQARVELAIERLEVARNG